MTIYGLHNSVGLLIYWEQTQLNHYELGLERDSYSPQTVEHNVAQLDTSTIIDSYSLHLTILYAFAFMKYAL